MNVTVEMLEKKHKEITIQKEEISKMKNDLEAIERIYIESVHAFEMMKSSPLYHEWRKKVSLAKSA